MKRFYFVALLFVLLAFPSTVLADVAPPIYPPGSNPQPGTEATQVRMSAETVIIEVQKDIAPESLGRAHVTADFTMHNLGTADESMAVRFPISSNDGRGQYPEISNLQITVNGKLVQFRRASYPDIHYSDENVPWAEFDVTFPSGQDLPIRVTYDLQGSGYYPYTAFYYILESGAGWKDTIGSADVILRLPYEANPQNVVLNLEIGWATTASGGAFDGNEVRWHFDNFEPGQNQPVQNMEFALVAPSAWQAVLTARANTEQHPNDGEAWGMLGKAYKQIFFMNKGYREDEGGQELYQASVEAYEKCLSLKPNDAQWHAGFADLLAQHAMWDSSPWTGGGPSSETYRALNEMRTALELAPNDPVVRELAQNMVYMTYGGITQNGDTFDFPWLTATPTALPSFTPTVGPVDELTATPPSPPAPTDTPLGDVTQVSLTPSNPTPVPQASNPICGSAALLPVIVALWFIWKRK
jgi:tetratricopeptide (TPR) repeat protein